MTIKEQKNGSELTLMLIGRLDTATAPQLDAFFAENLDGISALNIDLVELDYISSAGLRSLLSALKKMRGKGTMTVKNPNEIVREIFDMTGFSDILTIE